MRDRTVDLLWQSIFCLIFGIQLLLILTVFLSTAKLEQYVFTRKLYVGDVHVPKV